MEGSRFYLPLVTQNSPFILFKLNKIYSNQIQVKSWLSGSDYDLQTLSKNLFFVNLMLFLKAVILNLDLRLDLRLFFYERKYENLIFLKHCKKRNKITFQNNDRCSWFHTNSNDGKIDKKQISGWNLKH